MSDNCKFEYDNANCTNCANGLPASAYECAKTRGKLKEYVHERAEDNRKSIRIEAVKELLAAYDVESVDDLIVNVRAKAVEDCIKVVHEYFINLLKSNEDWEIDSIDDYALIPNKEICIRLNKLKENHD